MKTQIMTKLKKLKLLQTSKTQLVTKLIDSTCEEKKQKPQLRHNSKTQIGTQINSNCDNTQKLILWQN